MPRDHSKRSIKPQAVKARLKKTNAAIARHDEDLQYIYPGMKPVEEWDFEELQCGKPRDPITGKISRRGGRPAWITPIILAEAQKRLSTMTTTQLGMYTGSAIGVMVDLMQSAKVEMVRYKAAEYVLNQIMGMPTQRQEISASVNVQSFLADVMVNPDGSEGHAIEDGNIIEGEYEENDN